MSEESDRLREIVNASGVEWGAMRVVSGPDEVKVHLILGLGDGSWCWVVSPEFPVGSPEPGAALEAFLADFRRMTEGDGDWETRYDALRVRHPGWRRPLLQEAA